MPFSAGVPPAAIRCSSGTGWLRVEPSVESRRGTKLLYSTDSQGTVLEVVVALGLLSATFVTMLLVTAFGTRPPRSSADADPDGCFVCEAGGGVTSVGGYPVCESCQAAYFLGVG